MVHFKFVPTRHKKKKTNGSPLGPARLRGSPQAQAFARVLTPGKGGKKAGRRGGPDSGRRAVCNFAELHFSRAGIVNRGTKKHS